MDRTRDITALAWRRAIAACLLLSAVLRLAVLLTSPLPPIMLDGNAFDFAARRLVSVGDYAFPFGDAWRAPHASPAEERRIFDSFEPNAHVMPGYVFTVAATYKLAGTGPDRTLPVALLQNLLGVALVLLVALITLEAGGRRVESVLAALLAAVYLPHIWISNALMGDAIFTFLIACVVLALLRALRSPSAVRWLLAGALVGLTTYFKPTVLLLPAVIVVPFVMTHRGEPWREVASRLARGLALLGAATVLVLAPWSVRNAVVYHRWVPLTTAAGDYQANEFDLRAMGQPLPDVPPGATDSDVTAAIVSARNEAMAAAPVRSRLRIAALRAWESAWALLAPYDFGAYYTGITSTAGLLARPLVLLPHLALVLLAAYEALRSRRTAERLMLALVPCYFLLVHALTFPSARYLLPSMAIACVLAAGPLANVGARIQRRSALIRKGGPDVS